MILGRLNKFEFIKENRITQSFEINEFQASAVQNLRKRLEARHIKRKISVLNFRFGTQYVLSLQGLYRKIKEDWGSFLLVNRKVYTIRWSWAVHVISIEKDWGKWRNNANISFHNILFLAPLWRASCNIAESEIIFLINPLEGKVF